MKQQLYPRIRLARTRAKKLANLAQHPGYWPALRYGVAASVEHHAVAFRQDIRTVIDVGASRGQFALFAVQRFPGARVVCFEPLPESRATLNRVLGGRVEVRPVAIGSTVGTERLNVSARDDSSSLLPIGRRQTEQFPGTQCEREVAVPVSTLAAELTDEFPKPWLLKIDVQGFELEVLRGAGERLALVEEVFVECSFVELYEGQALAEAVVAFMHDRDFHLSGIHGMSYGVDGSAVQADFLFRRRS